MIKLVAYNEEYLALSGKWLRDPEIKELTQTSSFTDEQQTFFFNSLVHRDDYRIFGLEYSGRKVGAAGLKNIIDQRAEYWGYLGEKELWGKGLGQSIIMEVFAFALSIGVSSVFLKVSPNNIRAIKLYQKVGFEMAGHLDGLCVMEINIGNKPDV